MTRHREATQRRQPPGAEQHIGKTRGAQGSSVSGNSLRSQLVGRLAVVSLLLALLFNSALLLVEFKREQSRLQAELDAIEANALPAIEAAVWALDQAQIERLAATVYSWPSVRYLHLEGNGVVPVTLGAPDPERDSVIHSMELVHSNANRTLSIGRLTLQAPQAPLLAQLRRKTSLLLVASVIQALVFAVAASILLRNLVTSPLQKITAWRFEHSPEPGRLAPPPPDNIHASEELRQLVSALHNRDQTLMQRFADLDRELKKLRALTLNNAEIIWCIELTEPLDTHSAVAAQVRWIIEKGRLTPQNPAAKRLFGHTTKFEAQDLAGFPLVDSHLLEALIQNHYHVSDAIGRCTDNRGNERVLRNSMCCWIEQEKLLAVWGIASDITQTHTTQKALEQREQQLYLSQTRLSEAQALAHMGHWSYYSDSGVLQVSDEFCRIYGFKPGAELPTWADLQKRIHPEDKSYVLHTLSDPRTQAAGAEHRIIWPNGEVRYVQAITRKSISDNKVTSTFGILIDITDRRRAEEERGRSQRALAESEAQLAQAQAIAHIGHWLLDCTTQKLFCSDEFYRLLDLTPQERQLDQDAFLQHVHHDDQALLQHLLQAASERAFTKEFRIVRRDGAERFMRGTFTPFYAGGQNSSRIFGIMMDVTEQKQVELELRASQELFATAFDSSPDGIFFLDMHNGNFIKFNRALAHMLAASESLLLGRDFHQIPIYLAQDRRQHVSELMRMQATAINIEIEIETDAGSPLAGLLSWQKVAIAQEPCVLGIIHDVTPIRRLQKTAEQQRQQLIQADKLASIGTMVAGVAHEINNPNHLIQMNAQLLEQFCLPIIAAMDQINEEPGNTPVNGIGWEELRQAIPELLTDIQHSSQRINRIVSDLKDFARPQESSEFLPTQINEALEKTLGFFAVLLEQRAARVRKTLAPDLPLVQADMQRLEQVLVNLIMNAIEASEKSGRLELRTDYDAAEGQVICEVEDSGCGIPEESLERIFDPFFTTKQDKGGTGLGLAISYRLIQEHGGSLTAHRKASGGTIMRIRLPANHAGNDEPRLAAGEDNAFDSPLRKP